MRTGLRRHVVSLSHDTETRLEALNYNGQLWPVCRMTLEPTIVMPLLDKDHRGAHTPPRSNGAILSQNGDVGSTFHPHRENKAYRLFQGSTLLTTYTFFVLFHLRDQSNQVGRKNYWHCWEGYLATPMGDREPRPMATLQVPSGKLWVD